VIISPEWAGMVPPGLKNLLLFAGPNGDRRDDDRLVVPPVPLVDNETRRDEHRQ